jgi:hypothetical protein
MSADKLSLYNDALTLCGERMLASLTENRESRRLLDQAWASGAVDFCLETGQWNFAVNSIKLEYSPSVEPPFGYRYAFDKPVDYIRTMAVCCDEYFQEPLLRYIDEAQYWFSDYDTIYVRYVSNLDEYGMNMGKWSPTFSEMVSSYLAKKVVTKLTQDVAKWKMVDDDFKARRLEAKSNDAMMEPTKFMPRGSWVRARTAGRNGYVDDGGYLTGPLVD